jgi:hypothetical protein
LHCFEVLEIAVNTLYRLLKIALPTLLVAALAACGGGASTVAINGTGGTGGGGSTGGTPGTLALSATSYVASQPASSVTIVVNRSGGSSGAVSVGYSTSNGTATAGAEYTASSGTLTWADGDAAAKSIAVPLSATAFAGSRNFTVTLSAPSGSATLGSPSSAAVSITGSTPAAAGTLALAAASYSVNQATGTATLSVTRTGGSAGAVSVAYGTANGSASAGNHYTAVTGTLTWANGDAAAKSISVPLSATAFAGTKTFTVTLSAAVGGATLGTPASSTVTIAGSTPALAGTLVLSASAYSATQPSTSISLSVTRTGGSTGAVSVAYATSNGTASAGSEYTAASGTLNWADGDTNPKSISITLSTTAFSGTKTFTVAISTPGGGATLGTPASATVSVLGSAVGAVDVTINVNPAVTHAISAYIYGLNFAASLTGAPAGGIPFDRAGGNRWTAYNWENNASNAGSDYLYESDALLSSSSVPAEAVRAFIASDQAAGMASLITIQMQGLVAADKNGPVSVANPPDMTRFKTVVPQKSSVSAAAFTTSPPTTDANVYMDELLWAVDQKFPGQSIFGTTPVTKPTFIELDNEPELWSSTHLEIQGSQLVTSDAYIAKTLALTRAVKTQFPSAVIFGPVHYGFYGIYAWQGDLPGATPTGANWFPDKYFAALKTASTTFGRPLVDVYDFHWYSEATDTAGNRVVGLSAPTLSADQVQAIVQSPRSLWDPTYSENSWIAQSLGAPISLLPRLQAKINAGFPGMKMAITEYNNGGAQHIAGTIAQADNLGIFGVQNLFAANYWPLSNNEPYIVAAFSAFRNFDGAGSNFGDISLQASSSKVQNVVVYASKDSTRSTRTVFVAINRGTIAQVTQISGATLSGTAHLFQMTAASTQGQTSIKPVAASTQAVSGTAMTITLPALSVTTIDVY